MKSNLSTAVRATICTVCAVALFGCGGGGGQPPIPAGTRLIPLANGQWWKYRVSGSATGNGQTIPLNGILTVGVYDLQMPKSVPTRAAQLALDAVFNLNNGTLTPSQRTYFQQNETTGDILMLGDGAGPIQQPIRPTTSPVTVIPGDWAVGAHPYSAQFTNGDTLSGNINVTGTEVVATGVGALTAWKCTHSYNDSRNGTGSSTEWWAPQLGGWAKYSETESAEGYTITLTAVLDSTNVPISR